MAAHATLGGLEGSRPSSAAIAAVEGDSSRSSTAVAAQALRGEDLVEICTAVRRWVNSDRPAPEPLATWSTSST
jgi:hypothetical protein